MNKSGLAHSNGGWKGQCQITGILLTTSGCTTTPEKTKRNGKKNKDTEEEAGTDGAKWGYTPQFYC